MTGRAKWDAWKSIGNTYSRGQDAEDRYIELAKALGWTEDSKVVQEPMPEHFEEESIWDDDDAPHSGGGVGGMGGAVSAMVRPVEVKEETIHGFAISNDASGLAALLGKHPETDLNGRDEFVRSLPSVSIL
jgi:hypothetical protein